MTTKFHYSLINGSEKTKYLCKHPKNFNSQNFISIVIVHKNFNNMFLNGAYLIKEHYCNSIKIKLEQIAENNGDIKLIKNLTIEANFHYEGNPFFGQIILVINIFPGNASCENEELVFCTFIRNNLVDVIIDDPFEEDYNKLLYNVSLDYIKEHKIPLYAFPEYMSYVESNDYSPREKSFTYNTTFFNEIIETEGYLKRKFKSNSDY